MFEIIFIVCMCAYAGATMEGQEARHLELDSLLTGDLRDQILGSRDLAADQLVERTRIFSLPLQDTTSTDTTVSILRLTSDGNNVNGHEFMFAALSFSFYKPYLFLCQYIHHLSFLCNKLHILIQFLVIKSRTIYVKPSP